MKISISSLAVLAALTLASSLQAKPDAQSSTDAESVTNYQSSSIHYSPTANPAAAAAAKCKDAVAAYNQAKVYFVAKLRSLDCKGYAAPAPVIPPSPPFTTEGSTFISDDCARDPYCYVTHVNALATKYEADQASRLQRSGAAVEFDIASSSTIREADIEDLARTFFFSERDVCKCYSEVNQLPPSSVVCAGHSN